MNTPHSARSAKRIPLITCAALSCVAASSCVQDRYHGVPSSQRYAKARDTISTAYKSGALSVEWKDEGKAFEYTRDDKRYRYDLAAHTAVEIPKTTASRPSGGRRRRSADGAGPERGRQVASVKSPDGKWTASTRRRNLLLKDADGKNEIQVTQDGDEEDRIKYATGSWVYGEELDQRSAMWWSPDSKRIAFYRFDESKVKDYFMAFNQLKVQDTLDSEPFPKSGAPNPVVDLWVYDLDGKQTVQVDVRDGKLFDDAAVGHYVYGVEWSKDGKELLFRRTNRRQNIMEFAAADPASGKCRVIVREEWPASWTENSPTIRFLNDGRRFILASERTGWRNFYLYDLGGSLLATLTRNSSDVESIVRVDEPRSILYYTARTGDNPMKTQLHRVRLDGRDDRRLTDPAYHHSVDVAPNGRHFVDVIETHDTPPVTRLVDSDGKVLEDLAGSDMTKFKKLDLKRVELFTFKAADGQTDLYGLLHKPAGFSPLRKYPLLVSVYAGPATAGARESFVTPSALTEHGFLVASLDSRSANGRGKRFLDAIYGRLGIVEIDDQAAGVRALCKRSYVDRRRVGIFGSSYGGYASIMCLLRHPDVFAAACASSPVTDWRGYDSIYTERYMWTPQENRAAYDAGSAMTYARDLRGRLMIYYGSADNNVHPAHSLQLIAALQKHGKLFDVQIGPDQGHSGISPERMLEFFTTSLAQ